MMCNQKIAVVVLFFMLEALMSIFRSASMRILHVQWAVDGQLLCWCFILLNHLESVHLVENVGKQLSFVYDIADLYKMETSVPAAYRSIVSLLKQKPRGPRPPAAG